MPQLVGQGLRGVEFRAEDGGEVGGAEGSGVGDGVAELLHEVVGDGEEVVAHVAVEAADGVGRQATIRARRVGMQIAAIKATRFAEG